VTQLYGITGDLVEAEDAVQEAFARAVAAGGKWGQVLNKEAWLRTVALNVVRTRARRSKLFRLAAPRISTPVEAPGISEAHLAVVSALRQIGAREREVLVLHYFADLSVADIAQELDLPTGTVKTRLRRGRLALEPLLTTTFTEVDHG
jgi:RNA polymerase sigma-70 factor (ECF subfamily)